jgi:hypothetical protein
LQDEEHHLLDARERLVLFDRLRETAFTTGNMARAVNRSDPGG